jgi:hypothetical protein
VTWVGELQQQNTTFLPDLVLHSVFLFIQSYMCAAQAQAVGFFPPCYNKRMRGLGRMKGMHASMPVCSGHSGTAYQVENKTGRPHASSDPASPFLDVQQKVNPFLPYKHPASHFPDFS